MQEQPSVLSTCERAAERIQHWFGCDKSTLLDHPFQGSELLRRCDFVPLAQLPSHLKPEMPQAPEPKKETKRNHTIDLATLQRQVSSPFDRTARSTHCCVNQKSIYFWEMPAAHFPFKRMTQQFREHFLAFQRLKSFKHSSDEASSKRYAITRIHFSKRSADQEQWEEMIRSKENRLFQVDRVIKYLIE